MSQHVIDLPCMADTWLDGGNPNTNYGTATTLKGGWMEIPGSQILLKFNNSAYPVRKNLVSAKLRVYSLQARSASFGDINCKARTSDWLENTATYNNAADGSTYGIGGYANLPSNQYIEIDMTSQYNQKNTIEWISNLALYWFGDLSSGSNNIQIASRETANPPILRITYDDVPPAAPTLLDPIGEYKDNTSVIRFNWQYNSSVGGVQKKFDLLWSSNNSTWTTVSQTTVNNYYDMPANTIPSGNVYWKVKTYNEFDEVSPESNVSVFYVVGAPATPILQYISTDTSKPTINWSATSQHIFQVQVLQGSNIIYDSGSIASISIKAIKVSRFLADGIYTAKVRIKNDFDIWSTWGSSEFTITTTKPNKPSLVLIQSKNSVTATLSNTTGSSYMLLYRANTGTDNYICVAKSTTITIVDYTIESNKQYSYFVRSVSETETYDDSDIKTIFSPLIKKAIISPVSDLSDSFEIKYNLNVRPVRNITISALSTSNYYSGRKYPIIEYSEHLNGGIAIAFFIKSDEEYQKLIDIVNLNNVVLYRDGRRKLFGNINGLNITDHFAGYAVNFTITQTDYNEEVVV